MCRGVETDRLMVCVATDRHAQEMDFTGKPLKGFLFVSEAEYRTASDLASWLDEANLVRQGQASEEKEGKKFHEGLEVRSLSI